MKKNIAFIGLVLLLSSASLFASWGGLFKDDKTPAEPITTQVPVFALTQTNSEKSPKASETASMTDAQIADRLDAIAGSLDGYASKVEKMENDLSKIHFGIGAGLEYKQDLNLGASLDFSVRKRNLLFVGGITYFPINDLNIKDTQRIGGHASMLWEF
jgi:hypothetical protein